MGVLVAGASPACMGPIAEDGKALVGLVLSVGSDTVKQ